MKERTVLAFDFGASSGRAIIYTYKDGKLSGEEINRFPNTPVKKEGVLYWDVDFLFTKIDESVKKALTYDIDSIGIDTWGVDFALVSGNEIVLNPINYRDEGVNGLSKITDRKISNGRIYELTGIQTMDINTINRFALLDEHIPRWREKKSVMLLMADLFAWYLTGEKRTELTNASTTSMINAKTRQFDCEIADVLKLNKDMFAPIILPGEIYGFLKSKYTDRKIPVVAVCTHDTASAVAAVPAETKQFAYLSCGTWSLLGTETDIPKTDAIARQYNFTNEIGYGGSVRLLKNIVGLWLLQEVKRNYEQSGRKMTYPEMSAMAKSVETNSFIDPDDELFMPRGDMLKNVEIFIKKTNQNPQIADAEKIKVIYESLALKYRYVIEKLCMLTGKKFDALHIIGGGTQDEYLMQLAADVTELTVYAGPVEATAMGNAAVQFIALGEIADLDEARAVVARSCERKCYLPQNHEKWQEKYKKFNKIMEDIKC